jgi:energy-coupling factor transport system ATP-binding protein
MVQIPLAVKNLSFRYRLREEPALRGISFEIRPGEIVVIAGASGCGKTTLARCVNGLIPRSYRGEWSGSVQIFGREVNETPLAEVSQQVGTLLQDPERQIVGSYVRGEIAFGPENLGLPIDEIEARVQAVADRLGIAALLDRQTFALSGGEKQKVALAGALAMQPSILLLDEPLASLDPASAQEALAVFRRLADEGTSILLIEHKVEDALAARPERMLYMEEGEIRYLGPIDRRPPVVNPRQVKLPAGWVTEWARTTTQDDRSAPGPNRGAPPRLRDAGEPIVRFEGVSFAYGDGPAVLQDVSLEIRRGDLVAVLGANGAGKSTLVKHAIGLLKPNSGRVLVGGVDTRQTSVAHTARSVGYVFQSPSHMLFAPTVREELSFGPLNLGFAEDAMHRGVEESVAALNLGGLEEYAPLGLSFGQQKRTTIAAVVAMHSRVLIMDEPTAGQDFANYTRFMDALCRAVGEGTASTLTTHFDATLFITHDLDIAVTYANRVLLVSEGRVVADGSPEEVLRDFELLERCRIVPTSLLRLNLDLFGRTRRFLPAEALAAYERA